MTEERTASPAEDEIVDDARYGAAGTRKTARWIASAMGGIPSLAIVGAVVRAPGENGFDPLLLSLGIGLATAGAVLGIFGFARVLAPVPLSNEHLGGFDMSKIPGSPYTEFSQLVPLIEELRQAVADKEQELVRSQPQAKSAEAEAARVEQESKAAEEAANENPTDENLQANVQALRKQASQTRVEAIKKSKLAEDQQVQMKDLLQQFARAQELRRSAFLLKAAEEVNSRYSATLKFGGVAALVVAAGLAFLAMAPNTEAEDVPTPALVSVRLNERGQELLDCANSSLQAVRIGGTDEAPKLITLPTEGCPAKTVTFPVESPSPLGSVETVEEVEITD